MIERGSLGATSRKRLLTLRNSTMAVTPLRVTSARPYPVMLEIMGKRDKFEEIDGKNPIKVQKKDPPVKENLSTTFAPTYPPVVNIPPDFPLDLHP
jgi:hypothetical protein